MSDKEDKLDPDGVRNDGVSTYPADAHRLQTYADAEQKLSQFKSPVFIHANNPHERLYVTAFDGTGNDKNKDPQHETNVGRIDDQIRRNNDPRIQSGYLAGPGTEDDWWARTRDGATGGTYDARMETMYKLFIDQARKWRQEDPEAEIRLVDTGFSRGGSQADGFARLVQERGIQDPSGAIYTKDSNGLITEVTYTKPPLVEPGKVAQAEMLFDAVSTGEPEKHDRRPPPSVISGLQIIAEDEKRPAFKSDHIIDPGQTPDGRFLGVTVAGAHSDIGGSYHRDGLGRRSENVGINYLNSLSDTRYMQNVAEPDDPRLNVVHRSEEGFPFDYDPRRYINRDEPRGYNERLVPQKTVWHTQSTPHGSITTATHTERPGVSDPFDAEPRDKALSDQFERQPVKIGQPPMATEQEKGVSAINRNSSAEDMFHALCAAAADKNDAASRDIAQAYRQSDAGQSFLGMGQAMNQQFELQQQQAAFHAQLQLSTQAQAPGFCR